jgi:isopentenyldiphosphate isomerase
VNPHEVANYKWQSTQEIKKEMSLNPGEFTTWFHEIIKSCCTIGG